MDSAIKNQHSFYLVGSTSQLNKHAVFLDELESCYKIMPYDSCNSLTDSLDKTTFVVLGGDGALNFFVNNLPRLTQDQKPRVVYFPTGTANDFARSLKLSITEPTFEKFLSILENGSTLSVPVMQCNDRFFINVASIGSPAKVTNSGEDFAKRILGKFNYYIESFEQLINKESYNIVLNDPLGEEISFPTLGFVVAQGMFAGGGVKVVTSFTPYFQDTFEFLAVTDLHMSRAIKSILELQNETPNLAGLPVLSRIRKEIKITADRTMPAKLDGEEYSSQSFLFKKSNMVLDFYLH